MGPEVLQKTVTSFQEGAAFVLLNHEDTNDLTPGEYAYDVQLTAKDGMVGHPSSRRPVVWKGCDPWTELHGSLGTRGALKGQLGGTAGGGGHPLPRLGLA